MPRFREVFTGASVETSTFKFAKFMNYISLHITLNQNNLSLALISF